MDISPTRTSRRTFLSATALAGFTGALAACTSGSTPKASGSATTSATPKPVGAVAGPFKPEPIWDTSQVAALRGAKPDPTIAPVWYDNRVWAVFTRGQQRIIAAFEDVEGFEVATIAAPLSGNGIKLWPLTGKGDYAGLLVYGLSGGTDITRLSLTGNTIKQAKAPAMPEGTGPNSLSGWFGDVVMLVPENQISTDPNGGGTASAPSYVLNPASLTWQKFAPQHKGTVIGALLDTNRVVPVEVNRGANDTAAATMFLGDRKVVLDNALWGGKATTWQDTRMVWSAGRSIVVALSTGGTEAIAKVVPFRIDGQFNAQGAWPRSGDTADGSQPPMELSGAVVSADGMSAVVSNGLLFDARTHTVHQGAWVSQEQATDRGPQIGRVAVQGQNIYATGSTTSSVTPATTAFTSSNGRLNQQGKANTVTPALVLPSGFAVVSANGAWAILPPAK